MTPIAQHFCRALADAGLRRKIDDRDGVLPLIPDASCFEVSEVHSLIDQLCRKITSDGKIDSTLAFLPHKLTVIETTGFGDRKGFLFVQDDASQARLYSISKDYIIKRGTFFLSGKKDASFRGGAEISDEWSDDDETKRGVMGGAYAALAVINSPKVITQRERSPHKGLAKTLRQAGVIGELRPWHEVVLEATPTDQGDGSAADTVRFTGAKALHFCRAHIRIRLGKLELVSSHWRGDPALGIVQTKYRVRGPQQ